MIGQVQTKNGQKIVEPISGSIPTGNPVGTLLTTYKKLQPRNYLYCDGSTFNASQYPALYLYLGTNVLPDYREKAVYVYIKAVDGVDISDEDTFLDTVKNFVEEKNSYSTTEMLTGGKWIDGKPIYRRVLDNGSWVSNLSIDVSSFNIDTLVHLDILGRQYSNNTGSKWVISTMDYRQAYISGSNILTTSGDEYKRYAIIEYTKTTD